MPLHEIPDRYFHDVLRQTAQAFETVDSAYLCGVAIGNIEVELVFSGRAQAEELLGAVSHIATPIREVKAKNFPAGNWQCRGLAADGSPKQSGYRFLIWDAAATGVQLPSAPYEMKELPYQGELETANEDRFSMAYSVSGGVLLMVDHQKRLGVMAMAGTSTLDLTVIASPFRMLFVWVLSRLRHPVTHAAAVGHSGGAVLLGGRSGSGKSSTALHCLAAGLDYIGDDLCAVSVEGGQPHVHSLYATGKCMNKDIDYFPELQTAVLVGSIGEEQKRVFQFSKHFPNQLPSTLPIRAVVLPFRHGGFFGLEKGSVAMAFHGLASEARPRNAKDRLLVHSVLKQILRVVPVWNFYLGSERELLPAVIQAILEGNADQFLINQSTGKTARF